MTKIKQIRNQQELEAAINADFAALNDEEVLIPFGKYKNVSIEDVPNYYLEWLLSESFLEGVYTHLLKPVEKEMQYREEFSIFIEDE